MSNRYTEAQAKASAKYISKFDDIKIRIPKGMKDEWKNQIEELGYSSMNQFLIDAFEHYADAVKREQERLQNLDKEIVESRELKYKGEKFIFTSSNWIEGQKVKIEFEQNNIIKRAERVVKYDSTAGDLFITINNMKYFYCEFA